MSDQFLFFKYDSETFLQIFTNFFLNSGVSDGIILGVAEFYSLPIVTITVSLNKQLE